MKVRLYLDSEIEHNANFKRKIVKTERDGSAIQEPFFYDMRVFQDHGRWYVELTEFMEVIPDSVHAFVRDVSCHDQFPASPRLPLGVYREGNVDAELDLTSDQRSHQIRMHGKTRETVRALYGKIRAESVKPVEPWDAMRQCASGDAPQLRSNPFEAICTDELSMQRRFVDDETFASAQAVARATCRDTIEVLADRGYITESDVLSVRAEHFKLVAVDLDGIVIDEGAIASISREVVRAHRIIPIELKSRGIVVASAVPLHSFDIEGLQQRLNKMLEYVLVTESAMKRALKRYYGITGNGEYSA